MSSSQVAGHGGQRGVLAAVDEPDVTQADTAGAVATSASGGLRARDVVAFGQEIGRVLSDGRVVGRAEPFAKVFASSRAVKRAVGAVAWVILEDIALDVSLDARGRLVSDTSVRQIAANLGMNKTTVARHLGRLREYGFVIHEETRDTASGRWKSSWYVLDPSACVERFTHTPTTRRTPPDQPRPKNADTARDAAVSASAGHGDTGSGDGNGLFRHRYANPEDNMPATSEADDAGLADGLRAAGVAAVVADDLVARFPTGRIIDALDVLPTRQATNAAGWLVRAISQGWQLHTEAERIRTARARDAQRERDERAAAVAQRHRDQRLADWAGVISAVVSDELLAIAVERVARPVAGIDRYSAPVAYTQIVAWAIHAATEHTSMPLWTVLRHAVDHVDTASTALPDQIPPIPESATEADDAAALKQRIAIAIDVLDPAQQYVCTPQPGNPTVAIPRRE